MQTHLPLEEQKSELPNNARLLYIVAAVFSVLVMISGWGRSHTEVYIFMCFCVFVCAYSAHFLMEFSIYRKEKQQQKK